MPSKRKRGQVWSMDLIIAVLIFLIVAGLFYSLLNMKMKEGKGSLQAESQTIASKLLKDRTRNLKITEKRNKISEDKLKQLTDEDYEKLKKDLGVNNEFCIFFENQDGEIKPINNSENEEVTGIGSARGDLNLTEGTPCGAKT